MKEPLGPEDFRHQPASYREYKDKVVKDALSQLTKKTEKVIHRYSKEEMAVEASKDIVIKVMDWLRPILQAGGGKDINTLMTHAGKIFHEQFNKMSKEELLTITCVMHLEILAKIVEADPSGTGNADLLAGL
jgi:hypothetical protein